MTVWSGVLQPGFSGPGGGCCFWRSACTPANRPSLRSSQACHPSRTWQDRPVPPHRSPDTHTHTRARTHTHTLSLSHAHRHIQKEVLGPQLPKLFNCFSAEMPINRKTLQPQKDAIAGKGRGEKRSICAVTPYLGTVGCKIQSHTVKSRSSKQTR